MRSLDWEAAYSYDEIKDSYLENSRNQLVVKSNAIIRRSRSSLSLEEQKIMMFLISKIKPGDTGQEKYPFSVREFFDVCGIKANGGSSYEYIKSSLRGLRKKDFWIHITLDDGAWEGESLVAWLNYIRVSPNSDVFFVGFHEDLLPYLFQLRDYFTQFRLREVLAMNSSYAVAIYELLKSYEYLNKPIDFSLEELKVMLNADKNKSYAKYNNFKQKVLDVALREINTYTDLNVTYIPVKNGRKVSRIIFAFRKKDHPSEYSKMLESQYRRFHPNEIPGQMSLF